MEKNEKWETSVLAQERDEPLVGVIASLCTSFRNCATEINDALTLIAELTTAANRTFVMGPVGEREVGLSQDRFA
eukprot:6402919-Amphidinium_carterae.1